MNTEPPKVLYILEYETDYGLKVLKKFDRFEVAQDYCVPREIEDGAKSFVLYEWGPDYQEEPRRIWDWNYEEERFSERLW